MRTLLLCAVLAAACPLGRAASSDAVIEIDASKTAGYKIPRTIYGTFLEPIGKSIYGGLWAQELENPSFEDNLWSAQALRRRLDQEPGLVRASQLGLPLPWEPLDSAQGMRYEPRWNDAANSARSLLIMALPGKQTGVRQQVFLPVHRVRRYQGSLYAKHAGGPAELEVSLRKRGQPDTVFARAVVPLTAKAWKRYEFALALEPGQVTPLDPADFVIALGNESRALIDQALLSPADNLDGMEPDMVEMCRALKTPLVRYGGNFTSGYHWRDGIGPMDKRVTMLNQAWGMPEYNHFGTDEFLRFCQRVGAEPQIALNLGSGTPEEAGEWVRYVNEHWGDRRGGLLWELGNELWGNFQIGYPTLERIAARTKAFSDAVRAVDPRARLIATGQDPDHFREWNAAQLALPPGTFHFLATHFVVGAGSSRRANPSEEFISQSAFALPVGLERKLREMHEQAGKIPIAFTEWLFHAGNNRTPSFNNMGGAVIAAGFLNSLMRVADFTPIADMTGLIEFGGIWKKRGRVYGVPAYWAFRMYSNTAAALPVAVRTEVERYNVDEGNNRIPQIHDVPYLDVVAALSEARDQLTIFCVNRDTNRDIAARINVAGFRGGRRAQVQTLAGTDIYQVNNESQPEAVHPVERSIDIQPGQISHTFPRASVTVLTLK